MLAFPSDGLATPAALVEIPIDASAADTEFVPPIAASSSFSGTVTINTLSPGRYPRCNGPTLARLSRYALARCVVRRDVNTPPFPTGDRSEEGNSRGITRCKSGFNVGREAQIIPMLDSMHDQYAGSGLYQVIS